MTTTLEKLVELYPDENWDWHELSQNPNISWNFILSHPLYEWNWESVTLNPNVDWNIIQNNLDKKWDWSILSGNADVTIDFVNKYPNFNWNWSELSRNPSMNISIVENNMDKPWDWVFIRENPSISVSSLISLLTKLGKEWKCNYHNYHTNWTLSLNPNIKVSDISNPEDWHFDSLSGNKFLYKN